MHRAMVVLAGLLAGVSASAQSGAGNDYSPYSVYGVGNIQHPGSAYNMGMGGVGIATRNKRFVNYLNPASATARDSLSFMADFGLSGRASIYRQENIKSANNLFNINNFVLSYPLWPNTAMMVGIMPYSSTGYSFTYIEQDKDMIGVTKFRNDRPERIVIWASPGDAPYIKTKPFHSSQRILEVRDDHSMVFELKVIVNRELVRLLFGFAEGIQVLRPRKLVYMMKKHFQLGAELYEKPDQEAEPTE